jgi:asparagine synthase (glutamine-hydrolysing)
MCGIAGLIYPESPPGGPFQSGRSYRDADGRLREPTVEMMVTAMHHRGPDDRGYWSGIDGNCQVHLGHARLAILDLSNAARQPMIDPDTGCVLVYNGEIYNFKELRHELLQDGVPPFASTGDTQVLLRAYIRWGPSFVAKLRGMFAFAIYDPRAHMLFLARDHWGIKPLYFADGVGFFAFASEVRALLKVKAVSRTLDLAGLMGYMAYGSVQEPYTLVAGIRSVPAGHYLTLNFSPERVIIGEFRPFKDCSRIVPISGSVSEKDIVRQVRETLAESVRVHLASDVPLGVFLSGGMDSSSLVALMADAAPEPPHTLTVAFEEAAFDESKLAREIAGRFHTQHTEIRLTAEAFRRDIPQWLQSLDQPSYDGANVWIVSRACRESGITVALSGLGSDELFGGYPSFRRLTAARRLFRGLGLLPRSIRASLAAAIKLLGPNSIPAAKAAEWLAGDGSRLDTYLILRRVFMPEDSKDILAPSASVVGGRLAQARDVQARLRLLSNRGDPYTAVSLLEMSTYMLNTLLRDSDQMSMAHSLEIRVPFIDSVLAELVLSLPKDRSYGVRGNKPLLRAALIDKLAPSWCEKPKKTFTLPFDVWLRGPLGREVREGLAGLANFPFRPGAVEKLWTNFLQGSNHISSAQIIMLYALSYWINEYRIDCDVFNS